MNFYFSILGLISTSVLKYKQFFYTSVVPPQKKISIFMELHELAILETSATKLKLNNLFQVVLHIQITKATNPKLKGEKSLFVFFNWG